MKVELWIFNVGPESDVGIPKYFQQVGRETVENHGCPLKSDIPKNEVERVGQVHVVAPNVFCQAFAVYHSPNIRREKQQDNVVEPA